MTFTSDICELTHSNGDIHLSSDNIHNKQRNLTSTNIDTIVIAKICTVRIHRETTKVRTSLTLHLKILKHVLRNKKMNLNRATTYCLPNNFHVHTDVNTTFYNKKYYATRQVNINISIIILKKRKHDTFI